MTTQIPGSSPQPSGSDGIKHSTYGTTHCPVLYRVVQFDIVSLKCRDGHETETSRSRDRLETYPWSRLSHGATSKCLESWRLGLGLDLDLSGLEPIATNAI